MGFRKSLPFRVAVVGTVFWTVAVLAFIFLFKPFGRRIDDYEWWLTVKIIVFPSLIGIGFYWAYIKLIKFGENNGIRPETETGSEKFGESENIPKILYFKSNDAAFEYASRFLEEPKLFGFILGKVKEVGTDNDRNLVCGLVLAYDNRLARVKMLFPPQKHSIQKSDLVLCQILYFDEKLPPLGWLLVLVAKVAPNYNLETSRYQIIEQYEGLNPNILKTSEGVETYKRLVEQHVKLFTQAVQKATEEKESQKT